MVVKISSNDIKSCSNAIDGLVENIEGTSLKEDFNNLATNGGFLDEAAENLLFITKLPEILTYLDENKFDPNPPIDDCAQTNRTGNVNFNGTAEHWLTMGLYRNPSRRYERV